MSNHLTDENAELLKVAVRMQDKYDCREVIWLAYLLINSDSRFNYGNIAEFFDTDIRTLSENIAILLPEEKQILNTFNMKDEENDRGYFLLGYIDKLSYLMDEILDLIKRLHHLLNRFDLQKVINSNNPLSVPQEESLYYEIKQYSIDWNDPEELTHLFEEWD